MFVFNCFLWIRRRKRKLPGEDLVYRRLCSFLFVCVLVSIIQPQQKSSCLTLPFSYLETGVEEKLRSFFPISNLLFTFQSKSSLSVSGVTLTTWPTMQVVPCWISVYCTYEGTQTGGCNSNVALPHTAVGRRAEKQAGRHSSSLHTRWATQNYHHSPPQCWRPHAGYNTTTNCLTLINKPQTEMCSIEIEIGNSF